MQKTKQLIKILFLSLIGLGLIFSSPITAQKVNIEKEIINVKDDEEILKSEPVKTIISFWQFSQKGKLKEANLLRTRKYKGIIIGVKKDNFNKEWEEIIYDSKFSFVSIEQVETKADDKWEIAVKVKENDGKEFYLFHTIVKNNDKWKIFRITF